MKKQLWLTPEQRELLVDLLKYSRAHMVGKGSVLTEPIDTLCKNYCSRRVDEILHALGSE